MRNPDELASAFRAVGLKVTPQRLALFRLLHDNGSHPSAEALHLAASASMPGISLRTVYQTLSDLVAMGELRQMQLCAGSARFDPNVDDHHHLLCDRCQSVRDVYVDGLGAVTVDAAAFGGFRVRATDLVFRGLCAECTECADGAADTLDPSIRATRPGSPHHHHITTTKEATS
ncbi:MAG: transcriptional repressor [Acidimicrobiales bacterium]|nr:transcriptional repressor [Acidimicrobiales bacterium]MCB9394403.1 transcriptional repressor [Acidimicrobiaceae bacterium]